MDKGLLELQKIFDRFEEMSDDEYLNLLEEANKFEEIKIINSDKLLLSYINNLSDNHFESKIVISLNKSIINNSEYSNTNEILKLVA